jgi:hypothetical protein
MKTFFRLVIFVAASTALAQPVAKPYYTMSIPEIDQDIRSASKQIRGLDERMVYYSERFLGAPYVLDCEAEGECGRYETQPLMNLKQLNCMTYCEIVMALALSDFYEETFNVLQHIRYRQGLMSMATRNHYTMVDWLPANEWCLEDVTERVGGKDAVASTRTISHKKFFQGKGIDDLPLIYPDRTVTRHYIPLLKLGLHEKELHAGDVVALIQDKPDIFSAHMLLIVKKDGQTFFRHASLSAGKVLDQPFQEYIDAISKKPRYQGMSFMRMRNTIKWRDGVYTHGKIVLPQ